MKNKSRIINGILIVATLLWLIYMYPKLPDRIPMHWGANGQVDGYGSKISIFFTWGIAVLCNLLFDVVKKIDPKAENYKRFESSFEIFKIVFTVFMLGMTVVVVLANFIPTLMVSDFICAGIGIMFAVIGNYMPKFKHNYTMGIKTPWTLASENVWNKTHRMSGPLWVAGGIAIAVSSFIVKSEIQISIILAVTAIITIIPCVYSYTEFNKEKKQ